VKQQKIYGIIYKTTNKINGKIYIGQTVQFLDLRISAHMSEALFKKDNMYFHKAIRKYGKENFEWKIIAECSSLEELNKTEIEMIKKYNTFENGYNLTMGGEGSIGFKPSKEARRKRSEAMKGEKNHMYGKHRTEETKKKIRKTFELNKTVVGKNNPWYGKHHSEETKKKQSEARMGTHPSEKTRIKMSISHENKKHTEETKEKMSKWHKDKKLLKETKNKIAKARSKKYKIISPEGNIFIVHGLRKFCRNYKKEELNYDCMAKVAQEKQKQHKGYKCRYFVE